jgi:DNA invertase Pin-like site-specific DNA recombinase
MNTPQKLYNVGMYVRLSRNDELSDSQSIESQQQILSKFIGCMPGWIEKKTYIDNGFSGGNFDRPAFQEMMNDIRGGKINLLLVKDLSRFGRNYLETGKYLEEELPALGCRFVALMDNVDTENGENDIVPFINGLNDYYLKNQSDKIKAAKAVQARKGVCLSGSTPFGYKRDPEIPDTLIIDEAVADVVRKLYEMRLNGMGYYALCKWLNENDIMPPKMYYSVRQNREPPKNSSQVWGISSVTQILKNEVYCGVSVGLKNKSCSYRKRMVVKRDESEWVRVENAHEPIVEKSLWEKVQAINLEAKNKFSGKRPPRQYLFSKMLVCPDCGGSFAANLNSKKRLDGSIKDTVFYSCKTRTESAGKICTRHTIMETVLKQIVLDHIKSMVAGVTLDKDKILRQLQEQLIGSVKQKNPAKTKRDLEQKLHSIETQTAKLYEDRCEGIISDDIFGKMITSLEEKRKALETELCNLNQSASVREERLADIESWVRLIEEKSAIEDLDRETLEALVDKIEVGEKEGIDGEKRQDVRIYYKFVGLVNSFP